MTPREQYTSAIESAILHLLKNAIITALVKRLPFLALPVINPLFGFIVAKVLQLGADQAKLRAFFIYTDLRTSAQASAFENDAIEFFKQRTPENEKIMLNSFYKLATLSG
jgi:hypothetical protein